ncbi:MAG: DNA cytosine methyltransferase [Brevundimonas sp.]|uniref:DNA cytosine methyltransferase n=1 Tax=Brevundimonas sp. TaxID=1871086 RepID=UPI0027265B00|nr:DNA cytosine methyltransferase [Brevundimonas sp.]MDO9607434.1 DNA cytosine methyltransferase [Brevundimonas sp.]
MRAIDLYAGIGGWSLGLRLAGVEVVASYEWWQPAVDTHNGNHGGALKTTNVRTLKLDDLPEDIELVVGSPPCTEFSYSNRGGSGDLAEGLKDLVRFFEVVEHLKPKWWAMENVPRVAEFIRAGFSTPGHALYRFRRLKPIIEVVDFSDYGAAQARRRCIVSNIPLDLIDAYKAKLPRRTLGDVISSLNGSSPIIRDPVWGGTLAASHLTEMEIEASLAGDELRMNRDAKTYHAVYNNMAFPDRMDEPSRTVTATCTRVSRESIVIEAPHAPGQYRRLTIRERASLQGFPINYQFYARSFAEKAKMVGNAIPPTFTYLLASAAQGVNPRDFKGLKLDGALPMPEALPKPTPPETAGRTYPEGRSFRSAIPGLRFKSGMRFELSNGSARNSPEWKVRFFFGPSKDVREVDLDGSVFAEMADTMMALPAFSKVWEALDRDQRHLHDAYNASLQAAWAHKGEGHDPFDVVDTLAALAATLGETIDFWAQDRVNAEMARAYVLDTVAAGEPISSLPGKAKLAKNANAILAGLIVGDWYNVSRHSKGKQRRAA